MNQEEFTLSMEGAMLANLFVTRQVVAALVAKGVLAQPEMQACFEAAKEDLHRSTVSVSADQANKLLALVWPGFVPTQNEPH